MVVGEIVLVWKVERHVRDPAAVEGVSCSC